MSAVSVILLIVAMGLALLLGPQTLAWSWGPALAVLGVAVAFAALVRPAAGFAKSVAVPMLLAAGWIAGRAVATPVLDDMRDDLLLLGAMLACAWVCSRLDPAGRALRGCFAGFSLLALANGTMALLQWQNLELIWPYASKPVGAPTGFFGHYIDFSCFMGALGLLGLSRVLISRDVWWLKALHLLAVAIVVVTIPLSGARAGLLGLGVGGAGFLVGWLIVLWRRRSKAFGPLAIAMPLLLMGAVAVIWPSLRGVDSDRVNAAGLARFSDNNIRLKFYKLALKMTESHPMVGGGSRSFAWEKNQAWDLEQMGRNSSDEPFAHNEFLQVAVEYGWTGAVLVTVAVLAMLLMQVVSLFLGSKVKDQDLDLDPLRVAVLAVGLCQMFQANFSFVFHLLPSTLVLGVVFGFGGVAASGRRLDVRWPAWRRLVAAVPGVALGLPLVILGIAGSKALAALWPIQYAREPLSRVAPGAAAEGMAKVRGFWPGYHLAKLEGHLFRSAGDQLNVPNTERIARYTAAVESYREVLAMHPYEAGAAVNLANTLSLLGRDEEAEEAFAVAIRLAGDLESGFQARFWYANHLHIYWRQKWHERRPEEALWGFLKARRLMDEVAKMSPPWDNTQMKRALIKSLDESITFLQGAGIEPRDPEAAPEQTD